MTITPYTLLAVIALAAVMTVTSAQASMMARNSQSRPTMQNACAPNTGTKGSKMKQRSDSGTMQNACGGNGK